MALIVKEDIAANPLNIGLFGTVGVVFDSDRVTNAIEQLLERRLHGLGIFALGNMKSILYSMDSPLYPLSQ
jgi:hypothetical protein